MRKSSALIWKFAVIVLVGGVIYFLPPPSGVTHQGMHLAGIFIATIVGLVLQPLPTAAMSLVGLAAAMITNSMDASSNALSGFANSTVWLIAASFFIAEGFMVTGLGRRIALWFVSKLGKSSLGLAYGMSLTDLVLSPATPSITARAGGVLYPIIRSLAHVQGSEPSPDDSRRRLGAYLMMNEVQVNSVTSVMFVTSFAGNPIAQAAALKKGIDISWGGWALAAIVPGLITLAITPFVLSRIYGPTVKQTPEAPMQAKEDLKALGGLTRGEIIMTATFVLLLLMWCLGSTLNINATAAAFVGIAILLCTGVITWKDMAENSSAWQTLIFFGVLVGMADQLKALGVIGWLGHTVANSVSGMGWGLALFILCVVYFYAHYFFASNTAHIVAMYAVFLAAALATGAPAMLAALLLAFEGGLFGGLTHYASGPGGVVYGSGYVKSTEWFRVGFLMSVVLFVTFGVTAVGWTKLIGVW